MQLLPVDFLETQAKHKGLSPEQTETLIQRLGKKGSEQNDAEALCISVNALRTRMTEVYRKFSIGGDGPGKLRRLHDFLLVEYPKTNPSLAADTNPTADPNALVQTIRAQVYADIKSRCGTMRVLDMEQPIGLGDIYTSVNILEKLSKNQRPPKDEWLKHDPEKFDRFLLGQVHQPGVPGLQAVEDHRQLMILGKPGAGKTTFMQRLAVLCNEGEFQPQRVPVFVTLREYAEAKGKPELKTYIQNQWETCGVKETDALEAILKAGQALILLDGLDEVKESDHDRVLKDIKTFTQIQQFQGCQCVMTCRIDALEYMFDSFTYVEIADFDKDQIADFANKWFTFRQDPRKTKIFIDKLNHKDNEPLRKLAVTPILLTLLCLIFEEESEFPKNRSDFYQQGVDWLLKKWDDRRGIKRDLVYKRLSLTRKKEMLSQFAFETFEREDYLFKKATVEQHIVRYIRSLPGASEDEDILYLDEEVVLKSITAQHGLLVERARGFYSFSHLTFQEYFTAQYIVSHTTNLKKTLQNLTTHITEKRYREIFLITAQLLSEADTFFLQMKRQVDLIVQDEPNSDFRLQTFLTWINQKADSVNASCKPISIRSRISASALSITDLHVLDITRFRVRDCAISLNYEVDSILEDIQGYTYNQDLYIDHALRTIFLGAYSLTLIPAIEANIDSHLNDIDLNFNRIEQNTFDDVKLRNMLQALKTELPDRDNQKAVKEWWKENGKGWVKRLQAVMIEYRNIGHDWQFDSSQLEILYDYYEANLLLVNCIKSSYRVTKTTRQYIEDTLLLPLSEIEKYPVPDAIANLYPTQPEVAQ